MDVGKNRPQPMAWNGGWAVQKSKLHHHASTRKNPLWRGAADDFFIACIQRIATVA